MSGEHLNARVIAYKEALASGELQETYQSLVGMVQHLRTDFSKKYKDTFAVANVMHGYLDYTYFYVQNDYLKQQKLKLAVVFNHQQVRYELWLLGQTKEIQRRYWKALSDVEWVNSEAMPEYSIFEVPLLANPDFDNINKLTDSLHNAFEALSLDIVKTLEAHE